MDKTQARNSIIGLQAEASSLTPSPIIQFFEIDIGNIGFDRGVISETEVDGETNTIFRFHNNVKLTTNDIYWRGQTYVAIPITAEGFEIKSNGTFPTPKLSLTVSDDGIPYLSVFKNRLFELAGDLVGAKVTRFRTFAKYIDAENFFDSVPPQGFAPDPNKELSRDIYFIERKSNENKNLLEFELSSIFELEDIKLPGRRVLANTCPFQYRGEGCMYEYNTRRDIVVHSNSGES